MAWSRSQKVVFLGVSAMVLWALIVIVGVDIIAGLVAARHHGG